MLPGGGGVLQRPRGGGGRGHLGQPADPDDQPGRGEAQARQPAQCGREGGQLGRGLQVPDGPRQGLIWEGHVGGAKRNKRVVRNQNSEERHHHPGRRRGVHHDREESARPLWQAALPGPPALLLPDCGNYLALLHQIIPNIFLSIGNVFAFIWEV